MLSFILSGQNFGAGFYNDHHFHYGYHIYAAAVLAKLSPAWTREYHDRVMVLIRDIANPSGEDPFFTTFRHKDWYLGSSWASGIVTIQGKEGASRQADCLTRPCVMPLTGCLVITTCHITSHHTTSHHITIIISSHLCYVVGDPYPNGRNQESSAEAIAAYEAVALYGLGASAVFADSSDPADQVGGERGAC